MRRFQLTIKNKIIAISSFSLLATLVLGISANRFQQDISLHIKSGENATSAVRNQMQSDMMHDAIRGDVLSALVDKTKADRRAKVKELDEHTLKFRESLQENLKLPLPAELSKPTRALLPLIESYARSAHKVMDLAVNDPQAALAALPAFQQSFRDVEVRMSELGDLVEGDAGRVQTQAAASISNMSLLCNLISWGVTLTMGFALFALYKSIHRPLHQLVESLKVIADGAGIARRMEVKRDDEFGQVAKWFNAYLDRLSHDLEEQAKQDADLRGQLEAIRNTQCIVEFDLDGCIQSANDNFLSELGFTLEEVVGRHHRSFVELSERESMEYANFWQALRQGQFQSDEIRRVTKNGSVIWLNANYTPIRDPAGNVYKIVKFARNVTRRKVEQLNNSRQLEELNQTQATVEFNAEGLITNANANFLGLMGYSREELLGKHHSLLQEPELRDSPEQKQTWRELLEGHYITTEIKRMSKSGKPVWFYATYNPVFDADGKVVRIFSFATDVSARKRAEESLATTLVAVSHNADTMLTASEELSSISQSMGACSEETATQAAVVASASEQVHSNVSSVAVGAEETGMTIREVAHSAADAAQVATHAVEVAEQVTRTMAQLGVSSHQIGAVVKTITSIAEQTNLLALNATIEAARAGGAGKGFAVVANEVKELAKETAKATDDISVRIEAIQQDTSAAVDAIGEITQIIRQIHHFQNTIASAVEEQSATMSEMSRTIEEAAHGTSEIVVNTAGVAEGARSTAVGASQTQMAATQLEKMATDLKALVERVNGTPEVSVRPSQGAPSFRIAENTPTGGRELTGRR